MKKRSLNKKWIILAILGVIGYFVLHAINLESLPVFADESIYIRWAQLIIDDAHRYLLFSMNDGKTPLFVWSMVPFLHIFENQLFAGRYTSILIGLLQTGIVGLLVWKLTKNSLSTIWSMILTSVLPFWFFYQRMALMDTLLTVWLSIAVLIVMQISSLIQKGEPSLKKLLGLLLILAVVLFLAIWTKLPAVLFFFALFPISLLSTQKTPARSIKVVGGILISISFSLILFLSTSMLPAFAQLFTRGGDFLYSIQDFIQGSWKVVFFNSQLTVQALIFYLGPLVTLSPIIGLFFGNNRRQQVLLALASLAFLSPMLLLAKVYYPRYMLPVSLFFTLSSSLLVDSVLTRINKLQLKKRALLALGLALYCANTLAYAGQWDYQAIVDPDSLPLVAVDRMQYLEEWSSGHGIAETVELLQKNSQSQRIAVATEGYFGTLPDGLLLYLHNQDVSNLSIDGIGQPVWDIPDWFIEKSQTADQRWLVVNSHRLRMELPKNSLIAEFCRPNTAPCLQIWNITEYTQGK